MDVRLKLYTSPFNPNTTQLEVRDQSNFFIYPKSSKVAQVTHSYSRRLPALGVDFTEKLNFTNKSRLTQLRISNPSIEHSRGSPEFLNQNLRQIGSVVSEL